MILTILDFQLQKTTIVEHSNSIEDVEGFVNTFLGHSSFQYMVSDMCKLDLKVKFDNENSHINIREVGKGVTFNSTYKSLYETIGDCWNIAEAIRTDIDAGNIDQEYNDNMDFDLYNNFSQKYQ